MLINLLVLLLWSPSLLGWGVASRVFLASGLAGRKELTNLNPGLVMILGFAPLAIISTSLHFFFALNNAISLAILLFGYLLLISVRRTLRLVFSLHSIGGALFVTVLVSLFASRPLRHFDTGLYHLQSIRWCTEYPLVRGLANLHERLAFTSVWTPVSAVLNYPQFSEGACFPVTCLLLSAFGWAVYWAIWKLKGATHRVEYVFLASCGCFWMWTLTADSADFGVLPSLSSDAPIYFATLSCVYLCLRFSSRGKYLDLFQALAISAVAATTKVSAAPLFIFFLIFGAMIWKRDRNVSAPKARAWIPVSVMICLLFAVWLLRSVWLSGYLVFPVASTALTFLPWHLPVPMAHQLVETLQAWARSPGVSPEIVLSSSNWIHGWLVRLWDGEFLQVILAYAAFGGLMIFASYRRGAIKEAAAKCLPAAAMLTAGTSYWMLTAPDPRYGYGYLFALACLPFSFGFASLLKGRSKLACGLICFLSIIPLAAVGDIYQLRWSGLPSLRAGPNSARQTDQGTTIYVAEGDQRIFNAPLPSTPYFRPSLLMTVDRQGRIVQFELPAAVDTPYYGIVPAQVQR